jgi:uncharacterized protein YkwD
VGAEWRSRYAATGRMAGCYTPSMKLLILSLFLLQNTKPEIRIPDLERHIHESVNVERRANDREPLGWDDVLGTVARAHSEDMAKRGYFKHVNPEGLTPMKRLEQAGYTKCRLVGENIFQNNLYSQVITERKRTTYDWNSMEKIAATTIKGWIDSADHRQNILQNNYTSSAVGVAIATDDKVYITQIFCGETN